VAELADAHGLGPCPARGGGSNPLRPTNPKFTPLILAHFPFLGTAQFTSVYFQPKYETANVYAGFNAFWGIFALAQCGREDLNLHGFKATRSGV
jgi:hypothetical protein